MFANIYTEIHPAVELQNCLRRCLDRETNIQNPGQSLHTSCISTILYPSHGKSDVQLIPKKRELKSYHR